jgi:hypothetical protein
VNFGEWRSSQPLRGGMIMGIYLITTDLKRSDPDYEKLAFEIKLLANERRPVKRLELVDNRENFLEVDESVWLLHTKLKAQEIAFNIRQSVEPERLMVIEVTEDFSGIQSGEVWDWLETKFKLVSF